MTKKHVVSQSRLLKTLDHHPAMPALLKKLPPRAAAMLFQRIGINDAAELMTMIPAESLLRALDESIWKSPRPGKPERVDVTELVEWLETWNDIGEAFLVERLAAMSDEYLVLLLACVIRVNSETLNPEYDDVSDAFVEEGLDESQRFAAFIVRPINEEHRYTVLTTLNALWIDAPERMLRLLNRLSITPDTFEAHRGWTTTALDVEFERRSFREAHGYVSADDARAFLSHAVSLTPQQILAMSAYDAQTGRHLAAIGGVAGATNPVHAMPELDRAVDNDAASPGDLVAVSSFDREIPVLLSLLQSAELLEANDAPSLLTSTKDSEEPVLVAQLRRLAGEDIESYQRRTQELAYLATVLIAAISVNSAALSDQDAKDAAFATCCLGFDFAQSHGVGGLQSEPGLVRLFMLGWRALSLTSQHVVQAFELAFASDATLQSWIREEANVGLRDLCAAIDERRFDDARDAVIFLSIAFDTATCRAIVPLLDELPRYSLLMEGGKRPEEARWIESKKDVDRIRSLLAALSLK
ncbi:MAG: hypothetical protein H7Y02_01740 [Candidatus Obscuribacterales bacterium]|nr:hypothetical protein [Steroidobacteraceae bacterium]